MLGGACHPHKRAAREPQVRAFFAMPPKLLTDLPADMVQHIVVRLTLAHHIARTAPTCKVVSVAARNAFGHPTPPRRVVRWVWMRFEVDKTARIVYHGLAPQ